MLIPNTQVISAAPAATDGWASANEAWTYASADDPTFTFTVAADVTTKYSPGMRVRLVQTTTKYFIVTAVSTYSGGNTTITVYGGSDYDLVNAAISSNYYSVAKAPLGFPLDPTKWTQTLTDTSTRSQASPVQSTWYNLGSLSLDIPIGAWNVVYKVCAQVTYGTGGVTVYMKTTLSTGNNSQTDGEMTCTFGCSIDNISNAVSMQACMAAKQIILAAKTTYFLNATRVSGGSASDLSFVGGEETTVIQAVCAYL